MPADDKGQRPVASEPKTLEFGARSAAADTISAATAAALVAPLVSAVDRAVATQAGGGALWPSFFASLREMATTPRAFVRSPAFLYVWALYGGTYAASNTFTSFEDARGAGAPAAKTGAIFAVNSSLAMWKDRAFARIYSGGPPASIPPPAFASWLMRDIVGMGVIFVAPPIVAKSLYREMGLSRETAENVVQLVLPMAVQPLVSPFHLAGYLMYNAPDASFAEHSAAMRKQLGSVTVMRCIRGFPPYCVGAIANKSFRRELRGKLAP